MYRFIHKKKHNFMIRTRYFDECMMEISIIMNISLQTEAYSVDGNTVCMI